VTTISTGSSISQMDREERSYGWILFAASVLGIAGVLDVIDGIVALARSKFYVANAQFVFSDLRTWGWITLIVGALALVASFGVMNRSQLARWFGMAVASLGAISQFMFAQAYPLWSLLVFACDVLVVYALAVHGGRASE
jgi:hypothetical protein